MAKTIQEELGDAALELLLDKTVFLHAVLKQGANSDCVILFKAGNLRLQLA